MNNNERYIYWANRMLVFRSITYKGGSPFTSWFPMSDKLMELLPSIRTRTLREFRARPEDPVFVNSKGQRATVNALYQAFKDARAAEPTLSGLTLYGLRHSFIDGLVDAGVHPRDIQVLAGHKKFDTTVRYTHRKNQHLQEIVTAVSERRKVKT